MARSDGGTTLCIERREGWWVVATLTSARAARRAVGLCLTVMLAGCDSAAGDGESASPTPPVITESERANAYPTAEVSGQLTVEGGCLLLDGKPVFWPHGTAWDEQAHAVVFDDAAPFDKAAPALVGGTFDGGGAYYAGDTDFRSWRGEALASAIERCLTQSDADVVLYAYPSTGA